MTRRAGPWRKPGAEVDAAGQEVQAPRRDPPGGSRYRQNGPRQGALLCPRWSGAEDKGKNRAERGGRSTDYFHLMGFAFAGGGAGRPRGRERPSEKRRRPHLLPRGGGSFRKT